ncbi:MAG: bifunctional glutamate N-acetyltransferase/amino-acid acetyltransferase ArgJ [Sumerlaeia bacterium]
MIEYKLPTGFIGNGGSVGLKKSGKPDLGIIYSKAPCKSVGMFTMNRFQGANIPLCHRALQNAKTHGVVVHSGQANVCFGQQGAEIAEHILAVAGAELGCKAEELFLGSTGVIGAAPNKEKITAGLKDLIQGGMNEEKLRMVPRAMMTTDLTQKVIDVEVAAGGKIGTITGFAKGSGMIHPNMATMLCYIITDVAVCQSALEKAFRKAVNRSFNCLTVDGDTSTSDMVLLLSNGEIGNDEIQEESADFALFEEALSAVCQGLTKMIAQDGEGATKLVTIEITGAATEADAQRVGKAVGNSNLVKTALFGNDPNWGRLACAVGYSGANFQPQDVSITLQKTLIFKNYEPIAFSKPDLSAQLKAAKEVSIEIDLGAGNERATVWTCDFSYDYVKINAEYTT